jgi:hypothetical protein
MRPVRIPRIISSGSHSPLQLIPALVALAIAGAPADAPAADDASRADDKAVAGRQEPRTDAPSPAADPRLRLTLSTVGYTDKSGVYSLEPRLIASMPAPFHSEVRVGGSYTDAGTQLATSPGPGRGPGSAPTTEPTAPARSMAGAALTVPWSVVRATIGYAMYFDSQSTYHDREAVLAVKPLPALELSGALRHRPFVELAEPLAVDDQPFYAAGPGGALSLLGAWPLTVDEVRIIGKISPTSWLYAYGDWRRMDISGGIVPAVGATPRESFPSNTGWNLSVGAGVSTAQLFGYGGPVDVTPRWDTWGASYASVSPAYYSPASIWSHSPGLEVRLRRPAFELAVEGGMTFSPAQSFTGEFGGASAVLRLGRVSVVARAQARSDPWFASRKAWIAVQSDL